MRRLALPHSACERMTLTALGDLDWSTNDALSREEYAARALVLASRPQFLIVDPTSRCNARCVMCHVSFRDPSDHGTDLPRVVFDKLAPVLFAAKHINLFATGEPTIAKDVLFFLDETRRRSHATAQIWLCTNGKHVPEAVLDRLMDSRMGLQFSVDGGTPEVFEAIRRGITFDQLCRSLELANARRGASPYPAFSFSSTISKRNVHDIANIFALAARYRVEQVLFYEEDPEVPEEEQCLLDESDRPVFEAQLPFINSTGIRYWNGLTFRGPASHQAEAAKAVEPDVALHCLAPWKVFYVRADGGVRTCCTLRSSMGDLNSQSFDEVWNGDAYVRLRRAFADQAGFPAACLTCTDPLRTWGEG
jgi:MoaA/NifB/PqqE/SkfB family radical SAM enzyme